MTRIRPPRIPRCGSGAVPRNPRPGRLQTRSIFLAGDNGTGKCTLVEALAVACGFNAEGGSRFFRFVTRATASALGEQVMLRWGAFR
jgi:predicted ATPase